MELEVKLLIKNYNLFHNYIINYLIDISLNCPSFILPIQISHLISYISYLISYN